MTKGGIKNQIIKKVGKWPLEKKISTLFSVLLVASLFFNWYNDTDVFRTGETYNGLNGPLYLAGYTILALALLNLAISLEKFKLFGLASNNKSRGKMQIFLGFLSLYFLIMINSVYFHPEFGLNLLSKKAEVGSMIALVCTTMISIGGYLTFRKGLLSENIQESEQIQEEVAVEKNQEPVQEHPKGRLHEHGVYALDVNAEAPVAENATVKSAKTYQTIKMLMQKDTKTPEQRRKEREEAVIPNAFSKNSGGGDYNSRNSRISGADFEKLRQKAGLSGGGQRPVQNKGGEDLLRNAMKNRPAEVSNSNGTAKAPQKFRTDL